MHLITKIMVIFFFISSAVSSQKNIIQGIVVSIADGDTLSILMDRQQYKIRLAEIDAPERGQPYATRAKDELSELAVNKTIRAEVYDVDRYGRYVARLYEGNTDINAEMVKRGAAWVYRDYSTDDTFYAYEDSARKNQVGIWTLPESQRIPPWEWRRGVRGIVELHETCSTKRYCREMTSCQEAQHYLNKCGVISLDGNGNGLACDKLCK
jgi:endonuclease YncB( thermonuclease family)